MPATIVPAATRLSDGTRLPFVTRGDADRPAVVFLHGLSDSLHSWDPVLAHMPDDVYSIAITLRGHGDADRPAAGYRVDELADDVAGVITAIGVEHAVIVGHSLGAAVAPQVALRHPDTVAALVLEAAFALPLENEGVVELAAAVDTFTDPVDHQFIDEFQRSTLSRDLPQEFLDLVISESSKLPAHVWKAAVDGFLAHDHVAGLASIPVPMLLIWGDADTYVSRREQDLIRSKVPRCALEVYAGIGHAVHWESPQRFADDLVAFIQIALGRDKSARARS